MSREEVPVKNNRKIAYRSNEDYLPHHQLNISSVVQYNDHFKTNAAIRQRVIHLLSTHEGGGVTKVHMLALGSTDNVQMHRKQRGIIHCDNSLSVFGLFK